MTTQSDPAPAAVTRMPNPIHKTDLRSMWGAQLIVLMLLLLGAALRLPGIGEVPPGLYHDEAQHGLDALQVLEGHLQLYFPANNGREPLFIYLVTLGVALLGRSPLAIRLPSYFVGVLTLAATYDLARTLWGRRAGRWALAVLAVTLWHVHLSRVGFRAVLLPLFTALYLAQGAKALRTRRSRHWIAAGVLYGLSWYTYIAARFTPVALAMLGVYGLCLHSAQLRRHRRGAFLAALAALLILLPLGAYTLAHPDVVLTRSGQVSVFSDEIHGGRFWSTLGRHALRTVGMFAIRGDRIWRHNLALRPVWDPALSLAFILGVGVTLAHFRRDPATASILLWTATMAVPTLLAEDAPHFLRAVGVLPTAALLPAIGLARLSSALSSAGRIRQPWDHPVTRRILAALPIILVSIGLLSTTYDYFVRYRAAPLAHHWFEAGPVTLAGQLNSLRHQGWDGTRMQHGGQDGVTVYADRQLWQEWTALSFLLPESAVRFLSSSGGIDGNTHPIGTSVFAVWPYRDWEPDVLPALPHPAYLQVQQGPPAQGDLDPEPFTTAMIITAEPRPEVPPPTARFEEGIMLRAALVQVTPDRSATVHLWWETLASTETDYTVFVHYLREGERIAQDDLQPGLGHLRTSFWQPGDLIRDTHTLPDVVPEPGRDTLRLGLYDLATGQGLQVVDTSGAPIGDGVEVPVVMVED